MSKICKKENCNNSARYGLVNPETGMFEKHHCKIHKQNGEIGRTKNWQFRYKDMLLICLNKNVELLDSEEIYIEKTKKNGTTSFLNLKCNICKDTVNTTTINCFVNEGCFGCSCNNKIPRYSRYSEFLDSCKSRNVTLLDTKEEYLEKTKK
jgi:hypothetical protein